MLRAFCARDARFTCLYLAAPATLRSVSTRDFPRVTRLRNRSVSRYDIRDDWPITSVYRYEKLTFIGAQAGAKIDPRRGNALRVSPRVIPDIAGVFLSRDDHWRASRWTVIISVTVWLNTKVEFRRKSEFSTWATRRACIVRRSRRKKKENRWKHARVLRVESKCKALEVAFLFFFLFFCFFWHEVQVSQLFGIYFGRCSRGR